VVGTSFLGGLDKALAMVPPDWPLPATENDLPHESLLMCDAAAIAGQNDLENTMYGQENTRETSIGHVPRVWDGAPRNQRAAQQAGEVPSQSTSNRVVIEAGDLRMVWKAQGPCAYGCRAGRLLADDPLPLFSAMCGTPNKELVTITADTGWRQVGCVWRVGGCDSFAVPMTTAQGFIEMTLPLKSEGALTWDLQCQLARSGPSGRCSHSRCGT
jgi:hypothetical protein